MNNFEAVFLENKEVRSEVMKHRAFVFKYYDHTLEIINIYGGPVVIYTGAIADIFYNELDFIMEEFGDHGLKKPICMEQFARVIYPMYHLSYSVKVVERHSIHENIIKEKENE